MPRFHLTSQGLGRKAENVMAGHVAEGRVWVFDYTYYTESTSYNASTGTTTTSRHDHYFSCALAELPSSLPPMRIAREGFFSSIARVLGMEDIEVGASEFDRRFKVEAAVPQIALELLDLEMQQWLASHTDKMVFEVADRWVLVFTRQRELHELGPLLDAASTFRVRLPRPVLERYASAAGRLGEPPASGETVAEAPFSGMPAVARSSAGLPSRAPAPFTALLAMFVLVIAATVSAILAVMAYTELDQPRIGILLAAGAAVATILAVVIPLWARSARRRRLNAGGNCFMDGRRRRPHPRLTTWLSSDRTWDGRGAAMFAVSKRSDRRYPPRYSRAISGSARTSGPRPWKRFSPAAST